jgi:hypothetical protein
MHSFGDYNKQTHTHTHKTLNFIPHSRLKMNRDLEQNYK